jgi:cytochrome c
MGEVKRRGTSSMRHLSLAAVLFALAACGPANTPSEAPSAPPAPAATPRPDTAAMQALIAALPAPYGGADYEAGRRVFAQCRSCHTTEADGGNRVGPNLHGMFGRPVGAKPGFAYSPALQQADFVWDPEHLDHWLANPQTALPGNRMAFAGVRNEEQRRDLIAFLMVETAE